MKGVTIASIALSFLSLAFIGPALAVGLAHGRGINASADRWEWALWAGLASASAAVALAAHGLWGRP